MCVCVCVVCVCVCVCVCIYIYESASCSCVRVCVSLSGASVHLLGAPINPGGQVMTQTYICTTWDVNDAEKPAVTRKWSFRRAESY